MPNWYKLYQGLATFCERHFTGIWCLAVGFFICSGFITSARTNDWQLDAVLRNIIYGPKHDALCYTLIQAYLALIKVWFLEVFLIFNLIEWLESGDSFVYQRQYREYIVKKLILEVQHIDAEYLQKFRYNCGMDVNVEDYIEAYRRLQFAINTFRQNCRKLYVPTQRDMQRSCEQVFAIAKEDEELVESAEFNQLNLKIDDHLIKTLLMEDTADDQQLADAL